MARGGYQRPTNPAPVSGPGSLSRRTDGGPAQALTELPNARYGEGSEYMSLQQGAPLAAAQPSPATQQAAPNLADPNVDPLAALASGMGQYDLPTPLAAPTQRPDEPITAGAPLGLGADPAPEVAMPSNRVSDLLGRMLENDLTGDVAELYRNALRRGL